MYELAYSLRNQATGEKVAERPKVQQWFLTLPDTEGLAKAVNNIQWTYPERWLQDTISSFAGCHRAPIHGEVNAKAELLNDFLKGLSLEEKEGLWKKLSSRENYEPFRRVSALKGVFGGLLGSNSTSTAADSLIVRARFPVPNIPLHLPDEDKEIQLDNYIRLLIKSVSLFNSMKFF